MTPHPGVPQHPPQGQALARLSLQQPLDQVTGTGRDVGGEMEIHLRQGQALARLSLQQPLDQVTGTGRDVGGEMEIHLRQ
ncbi:hypothetical protein HGM15179_021376, partial [Zosterops borbonicus]